MQDFTTQKKDLFTTTLMRTTNSAAKSAFLQIYAGMYQALRWEQEPKKLYNLSRATATFIYCPEKIIADYFAGCNYIFRKHSH